jgi:hypothetical protein
MIAPAIRRCDAAMYLVHEMGAVEGENSTQGGDR